MLPAPPSSCAGWWFAQIWQAVASSGRQQIAGWQVVSARPDHLELRPANGVNTAWENVLGEFPARGAAAERTLVVARNWPGEDSMCHHVRMTWHLGDMGAYPGSWERFRSAPSENPGSPAPYPHRLAINARGRHHDPLDQVALEIDHRRVRWPSPFGQPRLPMGDVAAAVSTSEDDQVEITIAGLPLPWHIDLDREALPVWRRLRGDRFLAELDVMPPCPRHGRNCPWPLAGSSDSRPR